MINIGGIELNLPVEVIDNKIMFKIDRKFYFIEVMSLEYSGMKFTVEDGLSREEFLKKTLKLQYEEFKYKANKLKENGEIVKDIFISIVMPCCDKVTDFETIDDVPLEDMKCDCGNYIIKWEEEEKEEEE